jgi:hypothetical protein
VQKSIIGILAFALAASTGNVCAVKAQDIQRSDPKTKLDAFAGTSGAVILKGYSEVGSIKATGSVRVTAMSLRDAATNVETSGILFECIGVGTYTSTQRVNLDYDEIGGLLQGVDYVAKANQSITKLKNFEAIYQSKGGLRVDVFNESTGKISAAVHCSQISSPVIYISLEQLKQFRALILSTKEVLDRAADTQPKVSQPPVVAPSSSDPNSSPKSLFAPFPSTPLSPRPQ